ncbi:MAG: hypothetical protein H7323_08685 [Frankiales bacterium]|nr:hypothetical protein [Frankiales bacterium]
MTLSLSRRWAVPAVAAVLVSGATVLPSALASSGPADLTPRSAAQLLVDLADARPMALSGTVVQTSRLGLPELPGAGRTTGPSSLATGSHTLRVWADGRDRQRVALLGSLAEYDVVRDGRDVWTYSSGKNEAVHYTVPVHDAEPAPVATELPSTPAAAAQAALAAIDPTTSVGVEPAVTVAGRSARQLVLTPKTPGTLVGSVRLAVDAETSAPLRVQVFSTSNPRVPALEVGFTDVSFDRPDASVFAFRAPPGATVTEKTAPQPSADRPKGKLAPAGAGQTVVGTGWSSILILPGVGAAAADQRAMLNQLTTRVPEGRLLTTALVSVLLTNDGRLLVGAVTPAALRAAA